MRTLLIAIVLAGCGGPMLRNAPHPNPTYVAGGAAAVAGALTLLDPEAAANHAEELQAGCVPIEPPMTVSRYVPEAALDQLDDDLARRHR